MICFAYYDSPVGTLEIGYDETIISLLRCDKPAHTHSPSPLSELAAAQLTEYFEGRRKVFDLPIRPAGTAFQVSVWEALRAIPWGEIRSYGEIAAAIGKPSVSRAVGMACNRNPIWIIIPCHRVLGKNKSLTGYAGGLDMKRTLLELEQK